MRFACFFFEENLFVPLRGSFHIGYKRKGRGTLGGYQLVGKVVPAANKLCTRRTRRLADDYVLSGKNILFNFNCIECPECAQGAPEAVTLTKKMLNETIGDTLFSLLAAGAALSGTARTTSAAEEGLQAFLEKRDPVWNTSGEADTQ